MKLNSRSGRIILTVFISVLLVSTVFGLYLSEYAEETAEDPKETEDLFTGEIPEVDKEQKEDYRTATFGVWCFWGPDARAGVVEGVIRTRVGYWEVENSTEDDSDITREALKVDYDPEMISYRELYDIIAETGQHRDLHPFGEFVLADITQQSNLLREHENLVQGYLNIYPELDDFTNSTALARINGFAFGYGELDSPEDLQGFGLTESGREEVYDIWESKRK